MYPYITFWGAKLYLTGMGILVFIFFFLFFVFYYTKKYHLNFFSFFHKIPYFIGLPYIFGNYLYFVFNEGIIFPRSLQDFFSMLSPYDFNLDYIGILLGMLLFFAIFFRNIKTSTEKNLWIDTFFFSFMISFIPLGLFLLLGDDFFGKETESFLGVTSLTSYSKIATFTKVWPIGLFFSIVSLGCFLGIWITKKISPHKHNLGLLGMAIFLILVNFVLILQHYDRHLPIGISGYSIDIKNYITLIIAFLFLYIYAKTQPFKIIKE